MGQFSGATDRSTSREYGGRFLPNKVVFMSFSARRNIMPDSFLCLLPKTIIKLNKTL